MKFFKSLSALLLLGSLAASAQTLGWVKAITGPTVQAGRGITVDASGNVWTTGYFDGVVDLDPGPGVVSYTATGGDYDGYISKLDASGNFLFGGVLTCTNGPISQLIHANGPDVYSTGLLYGITDVDPGPGTFTLGAFAQNNSCVIKLNSAGNLQWGKFFGSTTGTNLILGIGTDNPGNVYLTGYFYGTCDFDPGAGTYTMASTTSTNTNMFVVKLDASGNFVWAQNVGGPGYDEPLGMAVSLTGDIYIGGYYESGCDFDPGVGTTTLTVVGNYDGFVLKLNSSGSFQWVKQFGGPSYDYVYDVKLSGTEIVAAGTFSNTIDLDPGAAVNTANSAGNYDGFAVKLNSTGNFVWGRSFGGTASDAVYHLNVDGAGNVYLNGGFDGTVDLDPSASTATCTSVGGTDVFFSKLNSSGNFVSGLSLGGSIYDYSGGQFVDNAGNVWASGYFNNTCDFDMGPGTYTLTAASSDAYILKLNAGGVGISNIATSNGILIYPNPTSGVVNLLMKQNTSVKVRITNICGALVLERSYENTDHASISLSDQASGIYFVELEMDGQVERHKLIKN